MWDEAIIAFPRSNPTFMWSNSLKSQNISVRTISHPARIQTKYILNTKQER